MRFLSLFVAGLMCGLSGTAMSQTEPSSGGVASLPSVLIEAPRQVVKPQKPRRGAVARSTVSPRTSPTTPMQSASPMSPTVKLAKLASATGSCVGGCVTSFRSGDAPWHGCSGSSGMYSPTCRNVGNYKTYAECAEAGLLTGWRTSEVQWYCSSLALK
jgi:hypothetical protein